MKRFAKELRASLRRKCKADPITFSFRYFRAMFLGGLIGSLLGTVLVKILTQFL